MLMQMIQNALRWFYIFGIYQRVLSQQYSSSGTSNRLVNISWANINFYKHTRQMAWSKPKLIDPGGGLDLFVKTHLNQIQRSQAQLQMPSGVYELAAPSTGRLLESSFMEELLMLLILPISRITRPPRA